MSSNATRVAGRTIHSCAAGAALALIGSAVAALPARADPVEDFYKGKELTIEIGYGSGGGYDVSARLFAQFFGKHIPGHPRVIVQNMPGAGSMLVANRLYNTTPKDGLVLGVFASSTALEPLFGNSKAHYDPRNYQWIGSLDSDTASCGVWKGAGQGVHDLDSLIHAKKTVTFGSTSPTAITAQHPLFLKHMFNANVKVIFGYKGTHDVSLAMMRGEVSGSCGMFVSSVRGAYAQPYKDGDLNIVVQFGRKAVPFFKGATVMYDMFKTDEQRKVADVIFRQSELARPLAAPPDTPKERVAALRKAMLETMQDPELVAAGQKMQIDFHPISGEQAAQMFAEFYKTPPALVEQARKYTEPDQK